MFPIELLRVSFSRPNFLEELAWKRVKPNKIKQVLICGLETIERLRITFTPNGKREFVPREQVFPLFFVYCLLLLHKNK